MKASQLIPKEMLYTLRFEQTDVLEDVEARKTRMLDLMRAMKLGNLYHNKVKINFKIKSGLVQQVETTVWSVTDNYIILKGGAYIPVLSILFLEF